MGQTRRRFRRGRLVVGHHHFSTLIVVGWEAFHRKLRRILVLFPTFFQWILVERTCWNNNASGGNSYSATTGAAALSVVVNEEPYYIFHDEDKRIANI